MKPEILFSEWAKRGQLAFYGSMEYYGPGPGSYPIMDRIDRTFGPTAKWYRPGPIIRKREKKPLAFWRNHAREILGEITGNPYLGFLSGRPGKLDHRVEWLYENILISKWGSRQRQFLVAIGKDAGVYPPPKWWKVTRRLQGKAIFSNRRKRRK